MRFLAVSLAIIASGTTGCLGFGSSKPAAPRPVPTDRTFTAHAAGTKLTLEEVDQLTYNFADRYFMVVSSAVDSLERRNPDAEQRRLAHRIKLSGVLAVNDIASSPDPYSQVLDLVVAVTLQSMVFIDENRAEDVFGSRAPVIIGALSEMRAEAWQLAAQVLTQEQLELLDFLIADWRRSHPSIDQVVFVKFDNFAGVRATALLEGLRTGGGLMAPVNELNQEAREYRRLAERAFWYSKRAPSVAGIQAEAAVNEILATPESDSLTASVSRLSATAAHVDAALDSLPEILGRRQRQVSLLMTSATQLVQSVNQLSASVQHTLAAVDTTARTTDAIVARYYNPRASTANGDVAGPPAKPFDVNDYMPALTKVDEVVSGVNQLALHTDGLVRSPGWHQGLAQLSSLTDDRIDRLFAHLYAAIGLVFVLAVAYRLISSRVIRA